MYVLQDHYNTIYNQVCLLTIPRAETDLFHNYGAPNWQLNCSKHSLLKNISPNSTCVSYEVVLYKENILTGETATLAYADYVQAVLFMNLFS